MVYENWNDNEPNNCGDNENCVLASPNGKWNDLTCTDGRRTICEKYDGEVNPWPGTEGMYSL
jgi:hypothetical protein